jgi:hypothetical protein
MAFFRWAIHTGESTPLTPADIHVKLSSIPQPNTMIRISKRLKGFREPLADAKRYPINAELAFEWLTENSRFSRRLTVTGAGYIVPGKVYSLAE